MRVLVVHPSPDTRHSLTSLLQSRDFTVEAAESTDEAVESLRSEDRFDVVVSAFEIEHETSGFDVISAAFCADLFAEVMVLSEKGTVRNAVEAMKRGAFDFLLASDYESQEVWLETIVGKVQAATRQRHNDLRVAERWNQISGELAVKS